MLKITISGKAGEGRPSAVAAITHILRGKGLTVEVADNLTEEELPQGDLISQSREAWTALDRLRGKKILIQSVQDPE